MLQVFRNTTRIQELEQPGSMTRTIESVAASWDGGLNEALAQCIFQNGNIALAVTANELITQLYGTGDILLNSHMNRNRAALLQERAQLKSYQINDYRNCITGGTPPELALAAFRSRPSTTPP